MKKLLCLLALIGAIALPRVARADHDKTCQNIHGRVAVITDSSITVGDKLFKVGETTRFIKDDKRVKVHDIKVGEIVCLDARGKDEVDGAIASVTVLTPAEASVIREREVTREKEKEKVREKEKTPEK
jgi:hypothetical protein